MLTISNKVFKWFIDLLYPRRCPICGDIALPKPEKACLTCIPKLSFIVGSRCKKCSKPIESEEAEYCYDCTNKKYHYKEGFSIWVYDKTMRKSIAAFKYQNKREFAEFYVEQLWQHFQTKMTEWGADALIPVPIHRSKLQIRGYNQADLLARGLGRHMNLPVLSNYLVRNKNTAPQKELNDKERLLNLKNAFVIAKSAGTHPNIKNVILVDDIYTTGSTIEACTSILLRHNIKNVYFISLCIGRGY